MGFHWVCGESHLDPPVALLKYEHTSCEKQSWVLLTSSVSTVLWTELSGVGLHTRHFLPPCLSNPLRIGHCTNNCFRSDSNGLVSDGKKLENSLGPDRVEPKVGPDNTCPGAGLTGIRLPGCRSGPADRQASYGAGADLEKREDSEEQGCGKHDGGILMEWTVEWKECPSLPHSLVRIQQPNSHLCTGKVSSK